ncbi:MAG: flavodoxin [Lachnospiraceae bacterium]|nr:flavodoxin [Lachnospiraceae bacterium]MDD3615825.1 flavodoxin [Lachnospiraceae bacterium]
MEKVQIVYWSGTGNTEEMANHIAEGVKEAGAHAEVLAVDAVDKDALLAADGFALGCPSMGNEELEDTEMDPFITSIEESLTGKQIVLFGSYGWGDGEWMRNWVERMETAGATVIGGEGVVANEAPDEDAVSACKEAGKKLAVL